MSSSASTGKIISVPSVRRGSDQWRRHHGVEALANAEHENTKDHERDKDRECDRYFHHQRHAARAGRGQNQPVLERHEADDLRHRVGPRDHHQEPKQDHRQRKRQIFPGEHAAFARLQQQDRERHQGEPGQHDSPGADDGFNLAMDVEPAHDALQRERNNETFDHECDRRRHHQMRCVLQVGLPGHRQRQHDGLQRKHPDHREDADLVEQQQAQHQHSARQKVCDIEAERAHQKPRDTNSRNTASAAAANALPRKIG
jgi:hypothetical protein